MQITLPYASFTGINIGKWVFYTQHNGFVGKVINSIVQAGRCDPTMVFVIDPPVHLAEFLEQYPEAREVTQIMADAGTGQGAQTPFANALALVAQQINISPANTAQQLPSLVIPDGRSVIVKSNQGNGNNVFVSDSAVNVASATTRYQLRAGDFVLLQVANLNEVWVLATTNNQKIDVIVEQ